MSDVLWEDMLKQPTPPPPPPPPMAPPPMGGMPPLPGMGMDAPDPPGKIVQDKPGEQQDTVAVDPEKEEEKDEEEVGKSDSEEEEGFTGWTQQLQTAFTGGQQGLQPERYTQDQWENKLHAGTGSVFQSPSSTNYGFLAGEKDDKGNPKKVRLLNNEERDAQGLVRNVDTGQIVLNSKGQPKYEQSSHADNTADEQAAYWQAQLAAGNISEYDMPEPGSQAFVNPMPDDIDEDDRASTNWKENLPEGYLARKKAKEAKKQRMKDAEAPEVWQKKRKVPLVGGKRGIPEEVSLRDMYRGAKKLPSKAVSGAMGADKWLANKKIRGKSAADKYKEVEGKWSDTLQSKVGSEKGMRGKVGRFLWGDNYRPVEARKRGGRDTFEREKAAEMLARKKKEREEAA